MFSDVHGSVMLATVAIFLMMIVVLNSVFYRPLLKFMDERNNSMKNDENKLKENSQQMLGANDELEKIHIETREEIHKIKQNAIDKAKEEAELILRAKKEELERQMQKFNTELLIQKEELKKHLSDNLPHFKEALQNNIKNI